MLQSDILLTNRLSNIVNFAIQPEPGSATVTSLHCNLTMRYISYTINVV